MARRTPSSYSGVFLAQIDITTLVLTSLIASISFVATVLLGRIVRGKLLEILAARLPHGVQKLDGVLLHPMLENLMQRAGNLIGIGRSNYRFYTTEYKSLNSKISDSLEPTITKLEMRYWPLTESMQEY